jgi:SulP family sulfate permease
MNISLVDAAARGWLLSSGHATQSHSLFPLLSTSINQLDWMVLVDNVGLIIFTVFICCVGFFLSMIGFELVFNKEIVVDKELQLVGIVNIVAGSLGWVMSMPSLSNAVNAKNTGGKTNLVIVSVLIVLGLGIFYGLPLIQYVPKIILSALLLYFGFCLLALVFVRNSIRLSVLDFTVMSAIFLTTIFYSLFAAIGVGIIVSAIIFVVKYSQINVLKFSMSGNALHSRRQRSPEIDHQLDTMRNRIMFYKLEGYIFFGTANNLFDKIKEHFSGATKYKFILLDLILVSGVDSSAMQIFLRIRQFLEKNDATLLLTNMSESLLRQAEAVKLNYAEQEAIKIFNNNDLALEWCEDQLLTQIEIPAVEHLRFEQQIALLLPTLKVRDQFVSYFKPITLHAEAYLFNQHDPADALYFIQSGEIDIVLQTQDGKLERLRKIGAMNMIGEMGLYTESTRTAAAIATINSTVYQLTRESLARMRTNDAPMAQALDHYIIKILSERLEYTNMQVNKLL